jgi:hypothetical protein
LFTKNGGGDNNWTGTVSFGPVTVINNDNNYLALANSAGSVFTYSGSSNFTNTSTGVFYVSHQGSSTFAGNVTANNSSSGGMRIGEAAGTSTQSSGSFITTGFANGLLILNNFTQSLASSNGSFNPTTFTSSNTALLGDFSVTTSSGDITITNGSFTGASTFNSAGGISVTGTCNFSTTSGAALFTKNGGGDNNWTGTVSFGPVTVINNDNNYLALANSAGSVFTYSGSSNFTNTSTGVFYVSHQGSSTFAGNVTANNSSSGGMRIGEAAGTSTQSSGSFITTGFANGLLILNNFTQSLASSNGSFNPTTFTSSNTTLLGDFSATTSSGDITITSCSFVGSNVFTSNGGGIAINNGNNFSTIHGTTTFQKNGGGDNTWTGGNTFGNVVVINNDNNYLLMANTAADDFNGSATFQQLSTGILYPAHNHNNTFSGNISTSGTLTAIIFGQGTGRMIIDGSTSQVFNGSSALKPTIRRMTMLSTGIGELSLSVPINISLDLTLTTGKINTTVTNVLTLTDETTTTTIGNSGSFVNGPMQYSMTTNSATRSTLNFPIGKVADWRPVILQVAHSTATSYTYRAEVFNASAASLGYALPVTVDTVSDVHYWDVDRFLTSTMTTSSSTDLRITTVSERPLITLYFGTNDGVYQGSNLTIVKNTPAAPTTWFDIGGSSSAGPSVVPVAGNVISTSSPSVFNSFSRFTLGSELAGLNPLPIELVDFDAECTSEGILLTWTTASEINNNYFMLERSRDGIHFDTLSVVDGAGNSSVLINYTVLDSLTNEGLIYYRLVQVDFDGNYEYSGIINSSCSLGSDEKINIYPNPSSGSVYIPDLEMDTQIFIYNSTGQLIYQTITQESQLLIDLGHLQAGTYYVKFDLNGRVETKKLIIIK